MSSRSATIVSSATAFTGATARALRSALLLLGLSGDRRAH
jgi:hypothetical protein